MTLFYLAAAMFVFVALKSWQQRNVAFDHFKMIVPTSLCMAAAEVFIIAKVAGEGFGIGVVLAVGLGGGLGSLSATLLHGRMFKRADH